MRVPVDAHRRASRRQRYRTCPSNEKTAVPPFRDSSHAVVHEFQVARDPTIAGEGRRISGQRDAGQPIASMNARGIGAILPGRPSAIAPRSAQLITELHELRKSMFAVEDVSTITESLPTAACTLVHKARQRGLVTRLKPGPYNLVPFERGRATEHVASPCLIARELVSGGAYFLSHGTAFELHRMVTQPNSTVYVPCTWRVRSQTVEGRDFHFVHTPPNGPSA